MDTVKADEEEEVEDVNEEESDDSLDISNDYSVFYDYSSESDDPMLYESEYEYRNRHLHPHFYEYNHCSWCILQKLCWVQKNFLNFLPQNDRLLS